MAEPNSDSPLTLRQLELINSTWALVRPIMQEAGLIMFYKLFEIDPELQNLFSFKGEKLCDENEGLRKHSLDVMKTVDFAISSLGDLSAVQDALFELGLTHSFKSVNSTHFAPVGQALIHALATGLKDAFTDEAKEAWLALYGFVEHHMTKGMDADEDED